MNNQQRKQITSVVDGMTVAEVRKTLSHIRKKWALNIFSDPMNIYGNIPSSLFENALKMNYCEFSFEYVLGHHKKRHRKNKK